MKIVRKVWFFGEDVLKDCHHDIVNGLRLVFLAQQLSFDVTNNRTRIHIFIASYRWSLEYANRTLP